MLRRTRRIIVRRAAPSGCILVIAYFYRMSLRVFRGRGKGRQLVGRGVSETGGPINLINRVNLVNRVNLGLIGYPRCKRGRTGGTCGGREDEWRARSTPGQSVLEARVPVLHRTVPVLARVLLLECYSASAAASSASSGNASANANNANNANTPMQMSTPMPCLTLP
jgi:hypothetical protein